MDASQERALARAAVNRDIAGFDASGNPIDAKGKRAYPDLPIHTYLIYAGLTPQDAREVGDEILKRAAVRVWAVIQNDPPARRLYAIDHNFRNEMNREAIHTEVDRWGFTFSERVKLDQGLKLGLEQVRDKLARATVNDEHGRPHSFEIDFGKQPGADVVVTNKGTGEVTVVHE